MASRPRQSQPGTRHRCAPGSNAATARGGKLAVLIARLRLVVKPRLPLNIAACTARYGGDGVWERRRSVREPLPDCEIENTFICIRGGSKARSLEAAGVINCL
jgi:hypothetical protein